MAIHPGFGNGAGFAFLGGGSEVTLQAQTDSPLSAFHGRWVDEEEGAEIVEFSLIILPLFGICFLLLAVGWVIFAKASLQYAVREGVRFAVTNQSTADIQQLVQKDSFGFLAGADGLEKISVQYYTPTNLQTTTSHQGGNLVEVSVSGVVVDPFGLQAFGLTTLNLSADSSDVMESSPSSSGS